MLDPNIDPQPSPSVEDPLFAESTPIDRYSFRVDDGELTGRGDYRPPTGGPGWDSWPEVRAARHQLSWGEHRGVWSEDQLSGVRAVVSDTEAPHYGAGGEWGVATSIPRNAADGPWDLGAVVPGVSSEVF